MDAASYLNDLVAFPSVSRDSNAAVSDYVSNALRELQFDVERLEYRDSNGVQKVSVVGKRGRASGAHPGACGPRLGQGG